MSTINIHSELAGKVARLAVHPEQRVNPGQELLIIESMKMEIPVDASAAGQVTEICVAEGDAVQEGQLLLRLQA